MTMYLLLGVQESATEHQIRAAYRTLARRYHPDVSRTPDAKKFARIHQAYNVVGSATNRMEYDEWLRKSREAEKKTVALIPRGASSQGAGDKNPPIGPHDFIACSSNQLLTPPASPLRNERKGSRMRDWFTGTEPEPLYVVWG
jgi:DnaJ-class molecular chaperone